MNKKDIRNLVIGIAIGNFALLSILTIPEKFGWISLAIIVVLFALFWERNKV